MLSLVDIFRELLQALKHFFPEKKLFNVSTVIFNYSSQEEKAMEKILKKIIHSHSLLCNIP